MKVPDISAAYLAAQGFSPTIVERFYAKFRVAENGCWIWTGTTGSEHRYGFITVRYGPEPYKSHTRKADIVSWVLHRGPVPSGLCVCHNCPGGDNSLCVNPDHLWLGTHAANMRDMAAKGRGRGLIGLTSPLHKLTREQVIAIRKLYSPAARNGAEIARRFGVNRSHVHKVARGNHYKDVI